MYKCEFPNCDYVCESRSQIQIHHIVPKELGGSEQQSNKITLCPNCHTRVYVPDVKSGIHSIKADNSIIIKGWFASSAGRALQYINSDGDIDYYFVDKD